MVLEWCIEMVAKLFLKVNKECRCKMKYRGKWEMGNGTYSKIGAGWGVFGTENLCHINLLLFFLFFIFLRELFECHIFCKHVEQDWIFRINCTCTCTFSLVAFYCASSSLFISSVGTNNQMLCTKSSALYRVCNALMLDLNEAGNADII